MSSDSEVEESGVGQWEPDDWAGSSSVEESEDDEEPQAGPSRRQAPEDSVRQGLSRIPLDVLVKAQRNVRRRASSDGTENDSNVEWHRVKKRRKNDDGSSDEGPEVAKSTARSSKHAPAVMSSKRQTGRSRQVIDMKASTSRDPRFMSDALHPVSRSIVPSVLRDEHAEVVASLETARRAERYCPLSEKERWTRECARLERRRNQLRSKLDTLDQDDRNRRALSEAKKAERERQKSGKAPWYMKKAEQKDILLKARFDDLDKRGGKAAVRKAVEKKRKKMAGKEKKSRPFARRA